MDDLSISGSSASNPSSSANDMDWFSGVAEEELLYYTSNDVDSLWAVIGNFVPPPPRPPYLPEEAIATDGLTTCDLCTWALRNDRHSSFSLDGTLASGEFGWLLTLVIVSLISAAIGAVVMVTLLHCRRMKSSGGRANCCGVDDESNPQEALGGGAGGVAGGVSVIPDRPPLELDKLPPYHDVTPTPVLYFYPSGHNVWSWLGSRRGGGTAGVVTTPLNLPQHRCQINIPVENHYTHMQTDEALYAELDSQTASYASDLQLQLRSSSTYDDGGLMPGEDDDYHELDAARLHRRYGNNETDTLKRDSGRTQHSQRLKEPDYEMYENGPSTPVPPIHLPNNIINNNNNNHSNHNNNNNINNNSNSLHHHHNHHHHHHNHNHHNQQIRSSSTNDINPSYQNTAYTGSDAELDGQLLSSAPSSAYYSDLSSNSNNHSTTNNCMTLPITMNSINHEQTIHYRLASINETTTTTPSDYI
ncbi:probable serine/threonine-protein kinase DDB_G0272282 isoform X2 [Aphidius gifuensis]|uniref:probable serine/threonine-protein kinase DDB_G0272282 isoform X2 n=1 Tax=Aphidius gifuensis TaxID=684658 RepID=UPI001CDB8C51|nr:probable serine/threonine-protein kinase DDB_G0272282 isoform X2 [Aphidius gifuensis]